MKARLLLMSFLVGCPMVMMAAQYGLPKPLPTSVVVPGQFDAGKYNKTMEKIKKAQQEAQAKQGEKLEQGQERSKVLSEASEQLMVKQPDVQQMIEDVKEGKTPSGGVVGQGKKVADCDCFDQRESSNFATNFIFDAKHQERLYRINPFCRCLPREKPEPVQPASGTNLPNVVQEKAASGAEEGSVPSAVSDSRSTLNPAKGVNPNAGGGARTQGSTNVQPSWNINYR